VTYRLEFSPEASADVAEAFSWYEAQRLGLGTEFEAELDRTLGLITAMPAAGRVVYRTLRRALVRRFPFAIYYILGADLIEIRAVLHGRRHPRTWRRRA
jgi:plasmid stabilization system protein ParE